MATTTKLTKRDARKVLKIIDHGLVSGLGTPEPGKFCVMAAINYALGQPHGDEPACVHPIIRSFDIALNDSCWSSKEARAKGMSREAIAKLGSENIDGLGWLRDVVEQQIKRVVPIPLRIVASMLPDFKEELEAAADRCEKEGTQKAAKAAAKVAANAGAGAVAAAPTPDEILTLSAEIATEACVKYRTLGSKWLDIVEVA